ncbi:outer membrane beta-barrel protein, partial [Marinospirillum sp.]|uniref:outer membrane beta-barrel protein n=1 Tax=Marinospirillum sp. TaxID=2183934 RepID=UPI0025B8DCEA
MAATPAFAEDSFWYGGANIGQSAAKIDSGSIRSELEQSGALDVTEFDRDNKDLGYKIFGGYQFNQNLAIELGVFDLGQFDFEATTNPAGSLDGRIKVKGLNLDLVGLLPMTERLSAFGRVGISYAHAKDNFSSTGAVTTANSSTTEKSGNYKFGAGVQYDFTPALAMRAEAERYRISSDSLSDGDVDLFSLGMVYRFGQQSEPPIQRSAAPVQQTPPPVAVKNQQYCSVLDIHFEIRRDEMQREDMEKLAVLGTFMNKYPETTAVIQGHSDNIGNQQDNQALS